MISNHQNHTISRNFDLAIIQNLYDFEESQKSANYVKSYAFFVSVKRHIKIIHSLYDFSQSPTCPVRRNSRLKIAPYRTTPKSTNTIPYVLLYKYNIVVSIIFIIVLHDINYIILLPYPLPPVHNYYRPPVHHQCQHSIAIAVK